MENNVPGPIGWFLNDNGFTNEEINKFHNFFNCFGSTAINHIAVIVLPAFWEFFTNVKTNTVADYDKEHFIHFVKYFLDGTQLKSVVNYAGVENPYNVLEVVNYYLGSFRMLIKEYQEYKKIKC